MSGFFGVVSKENCASDLFYGTDYHSHLGTVRGGMALWADGMFHRSIHDISNSPFRTRFDADYIAFSKLGANSGLGVISDTDDQPLIFLSHLGRYALSTVGRISNIDEITAELLKNNNSQFAAMQSGSITATEVVGNLVNTQATIEEGIQYVHEKISGSCSILLLDENNILYAARDKYGRTPVVIGRSSNGYCATLESCSLPNLGYQPIRDLKPGEVVKITASGFETSVESDPSIKPRLCSFLFVYFGYPASSYENVNVEDTRYRCGRLLAKSSGVDADIVAGIPDSGVGHALGYSSETGIRYERPFVKYTPTWPRSFTPANTSLRKHIAHMKLIPIPSLIKDRRIVFCDDSIVRGTQLKEQTKWMYDSGAKEVHIRIACPPLLYQCNFLNFSRSKDIMDLITRRIIRDIKGEGADISKFRNPDSEEYKAMIRRIGDNIGIDTLAFQHIGDLKEAIGLDGLCTYCMSGEDESMPNSCAGGCSICDAECPSRC
ncbi:MAG: amidophosphoribosyltransferase [Lentisphaerae bacterium]|nr:amidophosphoribosyltransferase [Lentisphaerota bacterium]